LVFKNPEFINFVNSRFIALKFDGNTEIGRKQRETWSVPGYPTMLVLTAEGNEIDRIVGFNGNKDEYFQKIKDYVEGRNTLQDLLARHQADSNNINLNYEIANKLNDRGDDQAALGYYQKVLALEPDQQSEPYLNSEFNIAEYYAYDEDNPDPLRQLAQKCSNDQQKYFAYSSLTHYFDRKKDQPNAIQTYEEAIKALPDNPALMNSYAWFIFQNRVKDKYQRGIALARRAVEIEPKSDSIWDTLGQLLFEAGYVDEAIAAMQQAADLAPDDDSYRENLNRYKAAKS
jgi:tetratricopeptide (TPR) repeat protein